MRPPQLFSLASLVFLVLAILLVPCIQCADDKSDLLVSLKGNKEAVYGVAFSPDGKSLLTVSGDPSIKLFQIPGGKAIKNFGGPNGHKQLILAVAMSPDGSQFATASSDNTVKLWDYPSNKHLREFATSDDSRAVAVSADGSKLAGGTRDGKIRIWNVADGKQLLEIAAHNDAVSGLAYNTAGTILVSTGSDGTLKYWNAADGKTLGSFAAHSSAVTGLAYFPNSTTVYTSGLDGTLKYWGPQTASRKLAADFKDDVTGLSLSPDGNQIVTAAGKVIRLSTLANGATTKEFASPATISHAAINPGGTLVAGFATDRRVYLWQTKDSQIVGNAVAHGGGVNSLAFNAQGNQLATVGKDGLVRLWTVPSNPTKTLTPGDIVRVAALSADGKRLAVGGADKIIRLYKTSDLKTLERQITGHTAAINSLAFSSDNNHLVSVGDDQIVRFWNLTKGEPTASIGGHTAAITSVGYLGTGQVFTTSADSSVKMWNVPATASKNSTLAHAGAVACAVLSSDSAKLLTGCADKQVRLWNLTTGQVERTWTGPTLAITSIAFAPNGARIVAGSADKSVTVWEAASNKEVKKFTLPSTVHSVGLTADGKHAVAGLGDGSVKLLDLTTGKEASSLDGHKGAVNALVFTPKGELLYGGAEGTVLLRNPTAKMPAATWKHGSVISAISLNREGTKAAVGGVSKDVKVYAVATGKDDLTIATPAEVRGISYSGDGKKLAIAGADGKTRIYSADGKLEESFTQEGAVNAVAFSSDNRRVLTGGEDKSARVWTTSLVWQGKHDGSVTRAVLGPRGDRIISSGADGLVRIWNASDGKQVQSIRAHSGAVNSVIVTADSARLATIGADKTARVWDWAKMPATQTAGKDLDKATLQFTLPTAGLSLAVNADGKRFAVGLAGEKATGDRVSILDSTTGKELIALGDPDGLSGRSVSFLPDGRTLLTAGDKTVAFTDVNLVASWEAHTGGASAVAWHNNGTQLLTAGADKTAKLWTFATGKLDRTFGPVAAGVDTVAFSRDYSSIAATSGKLLEVWNTADGKATASLTMPQPASALSFSSDKNRLATANSDGKARVWDLLAKSEAQAFLHTGSVTGVAFHPFTPTTLVSGGVDKTVAVHTLSIARVIQTGAPIRGLAFTPNQQYILTAGNDGKIGFYNPGNGVRDRLIDTGKEAVLSVAVPRNNLLVAAGGADKKVRVFNYLDGKSLATLTAPAQVRALAFSPSNGALVGCGDNGSVTTWDVNIPQGEPPPADFGKVLQASTHGKESNGVAFPTQGANYYTSGADKTVKSWKVASDAPTRSFAHPQSANCVAFNKAGTLLATGGADGKVRLFDLAKGTQLREINAHATPNNTSIYSVVFSPDDKQLVSASVDQSAKLWDAGSGQLVREFKAYNEKTFPKGHQEAILSVAFSPDGKQFATGSMDRTIKVWNVADGSVVRDLTNPAFKPANAGDIHPAHPGWVYGLRWIAGGKKLISAGQAPKLKGYLATWEPATGKLLSGKELSYGSVFALAVSPDEKQIALGTGGSVRTGEELNLGVVLKTPE